MLALAFLCPSLFFGDDVSPVVFNVAIRELERSVPNRTADFVFPSDIKSQKVHLELPGSFLPLLLGVGLVDIGVK